MGVLRQSQLTEDETFVGLYIALLSYGGHREFFSNLRIGNSFTVLFHI